MNGACLIKKSSEGWAEGGGGGVIYANYSELSLTHIFDYDLSKAKLWYQSPTAYTWYYKKKNTEEVTLRSGPFSRLEEEVLEASTSKPNGIVEMYAVRYTWLERLHRSVINMFGHRLRDRFIKSEID